MDKPTVKAALEHLAENNIIVYFRDILDDTVFVSVDNFSKIVSELFFKYNPGKQSPLGLSQLELTSTFGRYTEDCVSIDDFTLLFAKLMILVHYNDSYIIPCFLPMLNETQRNEVCTDSDMKSLFIKSPCTGYEFMSMLTVFLLTLPNKEWEILEDESGNPLCLYKNCIKFLLKEMNCIVTISFSAESNIELHLNSSDASQAFSHALTTILQGLEKIKLRLSAYHSFDFCSNLSFQCNCEESELFHTTVYNQQLDRLICERTKNATMPNNLQRSWLKSG
jgi:hypothetical protein